MKKKLGPVPLLYPMPALLVGTFNEDGTPNAMTAAWAGICCQRPPCLGVAIRQNRLTLQNIDARRAFTINIPPVELVTEVDYLGLVSGKEEPDKIHLANLEAIPGDVADAPILTDCPINIECEGRNKLIIGSHAWVIGEIVEVHIDEEILDRQGKVDAEALDPLIYCTSTRTYHCLGEQVGRAFFQGLEIKKKT